MKDLSIIQEYLICTLNEKGKLPGYNLNLATCFVGAGLVELQLEGCISMDQKMAEITGELPEHLWYLRPLYEELNPKKAIKIEKVLDEYMFTFTDKALKRLMKSVKDSLEEKGMLTKIKVGLVNKKETLIPSKEARTGVIEKIRAELLEEGEITEEAVILTVLLDKADSLKEYFSKYEQKELKEKLKEIRKSSWGQKVTKMTDHIEMMIACMIAAGSAAH